METKIDKSKVMKRAWGIYCLNMTLYSSFSACLKRAWQIEKENMVYNNKQEAISQEETQLGLYESTIGDMSGCASWYANARSGQYMGD